MNLTSQVKYIHYLVIIWLFFLLLVHCGIIYFGGLGIAPFFLHVTSLSIFISILLDIKHNRIDLINPMIIGNIALFTMFVARPLYTIGTESYIYSWSADNIEPYYIKMLSITTLAVTSFQIGYHINIFRRTIKRMNIDFDHRFDFNLDVYALLVLTMGLGLFAIFAAGNGGVGFILGLLNGRRPEDSQLFGSSNAYLYDGILMLIPASLMFFARFLSTHRILHLFTFIMAFMPVFIFLGSRGTRSNLLPLVLSVAIFYMLHRNKRPSAVALILISYFTIAIGINFLREVRTVGIGLNSATANVLINSFIDPRGAITDVIGSNDSEMADALALEISLVPEVLPYQHGAFFRDIYLRAAPKSITGSEALESNDLLVRTIWPDLFTQVRAAPAFSIVGALYLDSGPLGVIFGMLLIGSLTSLLWSFYLHNPHSFSMQLIFASIAPLIVVLLRGTFPDTLARAFFIVGPLIAYPIVTRIHMVQRRK